MSDRNICWATIIKHPPMDGVEGVDDDTCCVLDIALWPSESMAKKVAEDHGADVQKLRVMHSAEQMDDYINGDLSGRADD